MYNQEGIDYSETFYPIVKHATVRMMLWLAIVKQWKIHQMNVKNVFLNGVLKEEVYIQQPPRFKNKKFLQHVRRLNKVLYGLKQAPRAWFDRFNGVLINKGFKSSLAYPSLFVLHKGSASMISLLYVDDMLVMEQSFERTEVCIAKLKMGILNDRLGRHATF